MEGVSRESRRSEGRIENMKLGAKYGFSRISSLNAKITRQTLALFATGRLACLTVKGQGLRKRVLYLFYTRL